MTDIATRVHDHTWRIDPIVRSLLDTDFYKLLMLQTVYRRHADVTVKFSLINRSTDVPLARLIDEGDLRQQLDHIRGLKLRRGESTWLRGNTFYGKRWMFGPDFMAWLDEFQLPEYRLERKGDQYELTFEGSWPEAMMWEIPALAVLMELRSRAVLATMGKFELRVLYARATARLWEKIERLQKLPDLRISDFGTRRRHSFLWQDWCVEAMIEGLGEKFAGSSNCLIAMRRDIEAIGTNAHELPMVYAALAEDDAALAAAPYKVLENWHQDYDGNLRVILPDTYGTKGFLKRAPAWLASWTGIRIDFGRAGGGGGDRHRLVGEPGPGPAREARHLLRRAGRRPDRGALPPLPQAGAGSPSAGGRCSPTTSAAWRRGTRWRRSAWSARRSRANGRPTVKLSDNPAKALGPAAEVARYKRVFEVGAQVAEPVLV